MSNQTSDWALAWGSRESAQQRLDELNERDTAGIDLLPEERSEIETLNAGFKTDELHLQIRKGEPLTPDQVDEYNSAKSKLSGDGQGKKPCKGILDGFNFKDSIKKLGSSIASTLKDVVRSAINQAASVVDQVAGLVSQTIDLVKGTINDTVDTATKLAKAPGTLLSKISNGILDTVKSIEDEISKQIDRLKCVETYTDETASATKSIDSNIQDKLKAESPKKRKHIKEDNKAKDEFTTQVTEDIKKDVTHQTQKKAVKEINEENNNSNTLLDSPPRADVIDTSPASSNNAQISTPSAPVNQDPVPTIEFTSNVTAELISTDRFKALYKLSTGDTFSAYFGSKGNVIYTSPPGAERYISRT